MNDAIAGLIYQLGYLFTHLTLADVVDVVLVTVVFFIIFQALRQRRALQLLRGAIIFAILGAALLFFLPLNTFNWMLRGLLLASVVALPLLFQDELRQALTGLGQVGRRRMKGGSTYDQFKATIVSTVTQLSSQRNGALIVLEGKTPLAEIIETGIQVQAESVTPELLLTIFNPKTPLHDGAVIMRGDQLVAASCILPVQTEATGETHLGTRHRAALGLSLQVTDTLVVVVSEETGGISVAHRGHLHQDLSATQLEDRLSGYEGELAGRNRTGWQWLRGGSPASVLRNIGIALGLALIAWVSVIYQTNPPQQATITDVPLSVESPAQDMVLVNDLPETLSVQVQTTQDRLAMLDADSVHAEMSLAELPTGVHRVPIQVTLVDKQAQIVSLTPSFVDVTLEPRLSILISPTIKILDPDSLPAGYALGDLSVSPDTVVVQGPQSLVEQVAEVKAELSVNGRRADFLRTISLVLLDQAGQVIQDLQPIPDAILVEVPVRQTFYTREIAIQAALVATSLQEDYEITGVQLTPPVVTLAGSRRALEVVGDFLVTAPITLTNVRHNLILDVPLILPEDVSAMDAQGETVNSVIAHVSIAPVTDYHVLNMKLTLIGVSDTLNVQLSTDEVSVFLTGPRPLVAEIKEEPTLVTISVDLSGLPAGTHVLPIEAQVPGGLVVELFPDEVQVILEEIAGD